MTIDIRQLKVSEHAKCVRWNRITECIKCLNGIGEVVLAVKSNKQKYSEETYHLITTTGMIFVVVPSQNLLVTAYAGTMKEVRGLYRCAGFDKMPDELYQTIHFTRKHYSYLYKM